MDALEATDRPLEVVASETDAKQRLADLADFDENTPLDALEGILAAVEW
jgi:hypothetical protein